MSSRFLLFIYIIIIAALTDCNPKEAGLELLLGQNNAIWTQGLFLRGYNIRNNAPLTIEQIKEYTSTLKEHHIKYAYLFAGPYEEDGHLPAYPFSEAAVKSVELMKKYYPELVILPWVGGVQNKQLYLGDPVWVQNALKDTERLVKTLKVPGVHVDLEYILAGEPALDSTINKEKPGDLEAYGPNVNEFHRRLRAVLPDAYISSVVVSTSPDTKQWKRKTSMEELNVLIQYIDQLTFLFYDTRINDQQTFADNCTYLLKDIQTLRANRDIQYLIGVGTFINEPALQKYRNLDIENMPNTLLTIREQTRSLDPSGQIVNGISIA
jgi:hypothetical protein